MSLSLAKICRVCLSEPTDDNYFEFDKSFNFYSAESTIRDIFIYCTHLDIKLEVELAQRIICGECLDNLQTTYCFIQKALQSNDELKAIESNTTVARVIKDPLEYVSASDSEEFNEVSFLRR